ncbi:protein kinase domain-containing protein [Glycomyces xiaoerkulensis]|uniref:protein kinase domain-containing protein n=1 Tax=Glycomyces xiaoerkulensis TaxID=2038139 RepID=UPI000C268F06|nr:protein kinase [Glycomyces xiaoerkulensis]
MDTGTLVAERYRLDAMIASGGMGAVWRAFDSYLERTVAVKILHAALADRDSSHRFAREARILAGLKGPGLVDVYDYGETVEGGRPVRYIVMELIEGRTLTGLLEEHGRLAPEEAMRYVAAVAEALDAAHERGVVHRDIKPGNLLIEPDGSPRLVDFGISLDENRSRLTSPNGILGTPSYVSPEQLNGRKVCRFADFYSLGAVAYECLSGRPPFASDDPLDTVHMHLYEEPPSLPPEIPGRVGEVVARCLKKNPKERWPTGSELAAACRAAVEPVAVPAQRTGETRPTPPAATEELGGRERRRGRKSLLLAGLVPVLIAVLVAVVWRPWVGTAVGSDESLEHPAPASDFVSSSVVPGGAGIEPSPVDEATDPPGADQTLEPAADSTEVAPVEPAPEPDEPTAAPPATGAELPDVIGMEADDAEQHLTSLGYTRVAVAPTLLPEPGARTGGCNIVSQNPDGGEWVEYDRKVTISYFGLKDCP